ncbi:MFS transporter [Amycolatopsis pithecellobii]|uniref:MFS transporter n=1 Tax=Amycolatopsis pithecellobii TaxID=664692 RepID=A0A6N7YNL4_9PSEU|nr:MFS transporter [Amycolatopsis pithecellobii]MTD54575.1 MFS transporter [Amycolatopsis pithecellobii]
MSATTPRDADSIRDVIDSSPISRFQALVVGISVGLSLVDGFDLFVMSFAASPIAKEWSLNGSQVGLLLSSGLLGMALGSAFVAPLADRVGRRPLSIACLSLSVAGMGLAILTTGFAGLALCRILTGLGIGGLVASLPVIIAEYSPRRRRGALIALYAAGLPFGGIIGGFVATFVTTELGWRASFAVGAGLTLLLLLVAVAALPESLDFLLVRRPKRALERVNALLARMGRNLVEELPVAVRVREDRVGAAVLSGRNGIRSVLLWISYFVAYGCYLFAASWMPLLLQRSGFSSHQSINGGTLMSAGGVAGILLFGGLALVWSARMLTVACFVGLGLTFVAISISAGSPVLILLVAAAMGIFGNAVAAGLFAIAPDLYPAAVRSTAVGWAVAIGRIGAIVSPVLAGLLVDQKWSTQQIFGVFAPPMAVAALATLGLGGRRLARSRKPALDPDKATDVVS